MKTMRALIVTDDRPFHDLGDDWIVMQATRPLVGDKIAENSEFVGGWFYAAISKSSEFYESNIQTNKDLDARIIIFKTEDEQIQIALNMVPEKYRKTYNDLITSKAFGIKDELLSKLDFKTYGELI